MPTEPILGMGTTLAVDRGSGYETIVKLVEIGEFGALAGDVEVTSHDTTNGFKEFIRGLPDGGEVPLTGIWVGDATQLAVMTDIEAGPQNGNLPYRITLPQGYGQFDFDGYIKGIKIKPQLEGRLEFTGSAKISGKPTFATTAAAGLTTPFFVVHDDGADTSDVIPNAANGVYDYVVEIDTTATAATITPTAAVGTIKVNGTVVPTNTASQSLALGAAQSVTLATITVTEAGKQDVTYSLRLARK